MPSNFNKPIATIGAPANSATEYVSVDNTLATVLPSAVNAANTLADAYVGHKYATTASSADYQGKTQKQFEQEAAEARAAINDAAVRKDDAAVADFSAQYARVLKAEHQGAIDASNASIRQETLLKQYVNRFPHLDSKFRSVYSNTRAVNEANKFGQIDDPVQKGVDSAVQEAAAQGVPLSEVYRQRQTAAASEMAKHLAASNENIYATVSGVVDQAANSALDDALTTVGKLANNMTSNTGRIDGAMLEAELNIAKQRYLHDHMYEIISGAMQHADPNNPSAVLKPEEYQRMEKKLAESYDAAIAYAKTKDTKELLTKDNDLRKAQQEQGYLSIDDDINKINPAIGYLVKRNPEFATAAFGKVWQVMKAASSKQLEIISGLRNAAASSGNNTEALQFDIGLALLNHFKPEDSLILNNKIVNDDIPELPSYNNPTVDAEMDRRAIYLANNTMVPEDQAKIAKAALAKEQSTLGTMGPHWVINPEFAKQLKNPSFHKEVDQTTSSLSVTAISKLDHTQAGAISFNPDYNKEGTSSTPWKSYPATSPNHLPGPFATSKVNQTSAVFGADGMSSNSTELTPSSGAVATLNDLYWIKRQQYGIAKAAAWANEIQVQLDQLAKPPAEAKK